MTAEQESWFRATFNGSEPLPKNIRELYVKRLTEDNDRPIWVGYYHIEDGIAVVYEPSLWRQTSLSAKGIRKGTHQAYRRLITVNEERWDYLCNARMVICKYKSFEGFQNDEAKNITDLFTLSELVKACKPYFHKEEKQADQ